MSDVIELCELNTSLIHHFTVENNLNGLKEIITQRSEDIDKRNEVYISTILFTEQNGNLVVLSSRGSNIVFVMTIMILAYLDLIIIFFPMFLFRVKTIKTINA